MLGCLLLSVSSLASALNLDIQRDVFAEALALQDQGEWQQANQKINRIHDYPLAYIAEYNYLNANMEAVNEQTILTFINTNKGKAVSDDLQRSYLFYLAEEKKWRAFLSAYPKLPNNPILQCHYLQASIATDNSQKVWPDAKKIWLNSTSLPNECDDVYRFYKENKDLTQEHIWERFQLAYKKDKQGLMRFLITLMDKKKARLASKLYELHKKPERLINSRLFSSRESEGFNFLVPSINHLADKNFKKAMRAFGYFEKKTPFTFNETVQIKIKLSTIILQENKTKYFSWLDKELPRLGNVSLVQQRIRYAIKRDDWKNIAFWLKQLPEKKLNSDPWLYWQARVLEKTDEVEKANKVYEKIATKRSFYGFLAAQKLGVSFPFNAELVEEDHGSLRYLDAELFLIEELSFHQLKLQAKKQWVRLLNTHTFDLQQQLGLYAYQRGWPHLSVLASINNSESHDALNIRFPEAKPELFAHEAAKYDLEDTYIYAIVRRESNFDEQAKSPVGASGYMQLMPATAKEVARDIDLKEYNDVAQLREGKINVQLGTAYIDGLLKRYNSNRVLATAAYNAGPHQVDKWFSPNKLKGKKGIKMDSWVESIPYYETRAYVKNVLVYNVIYQQMLNKPLEFIKQQELSATY